jgi:CheY-like chemotaxis protein
MGQVFDNLIINAKQAMPSGGSILITARNHDLAEKENPILRAGRYIRISVSDTGAGIPPDQLKKIFDPFFTTKSEGSGLGLATCFSIVQKHEGYIEAESFPGMGSTFHILLPVSAKITEQSPESPVVEHRGSGTVLVMDDEEFITEIAGGMLSGMGYSVLIAGDGAAALRLCDEVLARGEEIDAAILDLTVPGGLGAREIVDDMKLKFPRMPVFASSGFSQDDIILKPSEYGFTGSIRKPYRRNELALLLMKHLKGASGQ